MNDRTSDAKIMFVSSTFFLPHGREEWDGEYWHKDVFASDVFASGVIFVSLRIGAWHWFIGTSSCIDIKTFICSQTG